MRRARPDGGFDECGEAFDGGRLEQQSRGDPGSEAFSEAGGRAGGDEGIAAESEEVVVEAGPFGTEQLREHLRHGLFRGGTGCAVFVRGQLRFGQCRPVELADRGQRDAVERHDHRGHHVRRQPAGDELGQCVGVDVHTRDGMDVRHQAGLSRRGLASHRDREVGIGVRGQRGVDLPELDPESADLDLEVVATHVDQPGLARSDEVTGAVQAGAGGTRDEPLGCQRGATMVAAGETGALEVELPHDPGRDRVEALVQHVRGHPADGPADRDLLAGLQRVRDVGHDGGLGGPVAVEEAAPGCPSRDQVRRARLAAHDHHREAVQSGRVDGRQGCGCDEGVGDLPAAQQLGEVLAAVHGRWGDHHGGARADGEQQLEDGGVEAGGREVQGARGRGQRVALDLFGAEALQSGVGDDHALGPARGTRGVDHIRGVLRP